MLKIVNHSTGIDDIVFTAVETRLFHKAKKIGNIDIFQITENLQVFQIADFYVNPEYRHSGIGKKLLAKAERHIIKEYNANVLTVVPARQRDAKVSTEHLYLIYEKLGFSFKTSRTLEKILNH